jgi:hypothetical protein
MSAKQKTKGNPDAINLLDEIERHLTNARVVATLLMEEDEISKRSHQTTNDAAWLIQGEIEAASEKFKRLYSRST